MPADLITSLILIDSLKKSQIKVRQITEKQLGEWLDRLTGFHLVMYTSNSTKLLGILKLVDL